MRMYGLVVAALAVTCSSALYDAGDDTVELTQSNFHKLVVDSDDLWLVEFYAPWCGHCKNLAPEWKKAATALKGAVKLGVVNADDHGGIGSQYGVRGFPTIKVFGENKFKPSDYNGPRSASGIVDSALSSLNSMVKARLSGGGKKSSGGGKKSGGGGGGAGDPADVVELTDSNFEKLVLQSDDMWLVEFFAPWCGHCKSLAPHWQSAATQLKGKVKLGALDATVHTVMAGRFGIQGFPTIKYFPAGQKDPQGEEYDGGRTSSDIVKFAEEKRAENVPAPEIIQLTEESVLKEACESHPLCIVSVLPHILDCQAKCRNDYITVLKELGDKFKKQQWGWVWAEAGQQMELEGSLDIGGFGYPALAAVNSRKAKYSLMRGSFGKKGINEFLRDLSFGKGSTAPLRNAKLPVISKVEAWDGKDGQLPEEEDIDLSDVDLDEKVEL